VHITVVCPQCKSRYQVDQALKGRKMRCPNQQCRAVFDVVDSAGPAPSANNSGGAVGSTVPVLPSEPAKPNHVSDFVPVEKAEAAGGANFADWRSGPPARGAATPAPPPQKQPPPAGRADPHT
jgi:hypothetical protein